MGTVERFEDLEIWQNAREITNRLYDLSDRDPFSRDFALRDQMRRAAISILSNIAEGFEKQTQQTFIRYLSGAKASSGELRAQLYIALDRNYILQEEFDTIKHTLIICSRQIQSLIRYLDSQPNARRVKENGAYYEIQP